jgi:adenylate kinase
MNKIKKNLKYLNVVASPNSHMRNAIIKSADKELICTICECIQNVINGNVKIDEKLKKRLFQQKDHLRKLQKKSSIKNKKKILIQKGGSFLPMLIPIILSLVSNFL